MPAHGPWCLHSAAAAGDLARVQQLLQANPGAALEPDAAQMLPLHHAATYGEEALVRLLLEAAPEAAMAPDHFLCLPLHRAAAAGSEGVVRLLLEVAPAAAMVPNSARYLPLHRAACQGNASVVRLLLQAAPAAAMAASFGGNLPLHLAAGCGRAGAVSLLLEAAPTAALAKDERGRTPLVAALNCSRCFITYCGSYCGNSRDGDASSAEPTAVRRTHAVHALLMASPLDRALAALGSVGVMALPLYAGLVASRPLLPEQWQQVPTGCPGLGAALPAVLARSEAEAGYLVGRLREEQCSRLCFGALCLSGAQRRLGVTLPREIVWQVLALSAG